MSSRSFGFDAPCSAHHNASSSSMWGLIRASISAWLIGGHCIAVAPRFVVAIKQPGEVPRIGII
jgi:hypothetical protein